jgi:hypothetical protein
MKMHKVLFFSFLGFIGSLGAQQTQPVQKNTMAPSCSQLSPDEKMFADKLNAQNKSVFCTQFNGDQRKSAMNNAGQMGQDGNLITNDQAVEKVAKDSNIMVPKAPSRPGGSCPVK